MTRARKCVAPAVIFLAAIGITALFSRGAFAAPISSSWEIKYTDMRTDLRALAVDPLDSRRVYVGTNESVVATSDGGATWASLQSFRDNKISLSALPSEKALHSIMMIEEEGAAARGAAGAAAGTEGGVETAPAGAPTDLASAQAAAAEATRKLQELENRYKQAQDESARQQAGLNQAQTEVAKWIPDDLKASEVAAIQEGNNGYVEEPFYSQLAEWLQERGLSVPENGGERKDALVDYLNKHEAEGQAVQVAVQNADRALAAARAQEESLRSQVDQAQGEKVRADAAVQAAEMAKTSQTAKGAAAPVEGGEAVVAVTPAPEEGSVAGVSYLAVDPSSPDRIYAATFDGLYQSADKGQTWSQCYRGTNSPQSAILSLAVDPSNPAVVFAGSLSGMAKSSDGGKTWDRPGGMIADKVVNSIAVHPFDSQVVLAGTQEDGAYKSADGGVSWQQSFSYTTTDTNSVRSAAFAPSQPDVIYLGTGGGLFRSADGGKTWDKCRGMGLASSDVRHVVVSPTNADLVFLATSWGVFVSQNAGDTCRRITFGTDFRGSNFLAFDPLDPTSIWLITDNRVYRNAAMAFADLSKKNKIALSGNCEFTLNGTDKHTLTIEEVDEAAGIVKVEIQSDPKELELKVGEAQSVDVDGDGTPDASILVEKIVDGVPQITIEALAPAAAGAAGVKRPDQVACLEDLQPYFAAEPTWVEVQEAAARWAEVHPDKIAAWRQGAALKAFAPTVDFVYTLDRGWATRNRVDNRWGYDFSDFSEEGESEDRISRQSREIKSDYYSSGDNYGEYDLQKQGSSLGEGDASRERYGERDFSSYRNILTNSEGWSGSWGLKFYWNLGDFLYSKDRLYISREGRDLVELRQDVLEQVTLQYFDRRSARIDMIMNPPADPYSKVEMLLRLQQLDAGLDALTGGFFTKTIKTREKELPAVTAVSFVRSYY